MFLSMAKTCSRRNLTTKRMAEVGAVRGKGVLADGRRCGHACGTLGSWWGSCGIDG